MAEELQTGRLLSEYCSSDQRMVKDMNHGWLRKRRVKADAEYGHGSDVETLSFEQRATLRAWTDNILQRYFKEEV